MTGYNSKSSKIPLRMFFKILILLLLIAGGAYYYWIRSPSFAVKELENAIKEKDLATFYSRLDLNKIYDSSIDAIAINKKPQEESPWEILQSNIGTGVSKVLKSQVMNSVKHEIELQFRRDRSQVVVYSEAEAAGLTTIKEFFDDLESLAFERVVRSGDAALVNVEVRLKRMAKSYSLTLKLEKEDDWRISGFEGLASTLTLYEKDKVLRLEEHNQKVQANLKEALVFFGQIRQDESLISIGQQIHFEFLFHNRGEGKLTDVVGLLTVIDAKGEIVLSEPFARHGLDIVKGQKKVFLIDKDLSVFASKASVADGLHLDFVFEEVKFEDGRSFKLVKSYKDL